MDPSVNLFLLSAIHFLVVSSFRFHFVLFGVAYAPVLVSSSREFNAFQ